jgi:hypothetical protein
MSKMGQQTAHVYLANIMQFSFSSKWGEYTLVALSAREGEGGEEVREGGKVMR